MAGNTVSGRPSGAARGGVRIQGPGWWVRADSGASVRLLAGGERRAMGAEA